MTNPYEIRRLDELDAIEVTGADITWRPVRRALGIRAFGINAYSADAVGANVVEEHTEEGLGHEEVYLVVSGRATFKLDDDHVEAPAGTLVYVRDPATRRHAVAAERDTIVLAVGGKPGEAYQPSAWEAWFAAAPHRERGEWDEALAILHEALEQQPDHGALLYNVACYEALAGRRDDALEHLRQAVAQSERWAAHAREDEDFESLRDDPEFTQLTRADTADS